MVAHVLVELKMSKIDKTFTYNIPSLLEDEVIVGKRVLVPFGKQKLEGYILKIEEKFESEYQMKDIIEVLDSEPVLNEELLELGKFVQKKTLCNLITAYQSMLPKGIKARQKDNIKPKYETYLKIISKDNVKNEKQKEILSLFDSSDIILKKFATNISRSAVQTLLKNGNIKEVEQETYRLVYEEKCDLKKELSDEQQNAYDMIASSLNTFTPFLLHGVTGSGKTEVYMQVIDKVLGSGKTALVLVPEISLTPQFISKFTSRFGGMVATLHSGLSDGEKYDEWRRIKKGEASIVIGARSAVFAPLLNIGIVIVDEEHSTTYKQDNNPRYSALDVALARAKYHNCPVVFGSATPSIESYTRAKQGIYKLLVMKNRIHTKLPKVELVDMKDEIKRGNRVLSSSLKQEIITALQNGNQVILLLNRRGYTTTSSCPSCGFTHKCPNCDIPLIYHKSKNRMICHYCGYDVPKLNVCPSCHNEDMRDMGMGTEKLEQYITENIVGSKVVRMDNDTTRRKGSYEAIINDFQNQKYNILIGTQMISKGLDFPNVTLVGVISADSTLNFPDFRSSERTFALLNQVAGRAGRGDISGKVIFQGFTMDHYSIVSASCHDYEGFYNEEMKIRKTLQYSPYCNLSVIKVRGKVYEKVLDEANKIKNHLTHKLKDVSVLGPSSGMMIKVNTIYELHIILKYKKSDDVLNELKFIRDTYLSHKMVQIELDISPIFI